jgi:hypothetical protein
MALPKPSFVSIQEAARELGVSEERIRYYLKEEHLTTYVPTPWQNLRYDQDGKVAEVAKAILSRIEGDEIYFAKLQLLDKNTLEEKVGEELSHGACNISDVQISFAEIERSREIESKSEPSQEHRTSEPEKAVNFFTKEGDMWHVGFEGQTTRIRHLDGIKYIAIILLQKPMESISCRELYQTVSSKALDKIMSGDVAKAGGLYADHKKQAISSPEAKADYFRRYKKLEDDLLRIDDLPDNEKTPEDEMEKKEIEKEMAALKPILNERTFTDPNDKKAQINIGQRLEKAYQAINKAGMKDLAKHLKDHIKTDDAYGRKYTGPLTWEIE